VTSRGQRCDRDRARAPITAPVHARLPAAGSGRYLLNLSDVAAQISQLWRARHEAPLPAIAGPKYLAAAVSFYSPDHPILFTDFDRRIETWIDPDALKRTGFVAICPETASSYCESALATLAVEAQRTILSQEPNSRDPSQSAVRWSAYLIGPAR
jgi:hypothetical protein